MLSSSQAESSSSTPYTPSLTTFVLHERDARARRAAIAALGALLGGARPFLATAQQPPQPKPGPSTASTPHARHKDGGNKHDPAHH